MHGTTKEAETIHAIVEGCEVLKKASKQKSAVNSNKDTRVNGSNSGTKSKPRLTSTSSSTSSQAPSNCCQYVSVVVTNENEPSLKQEMSASCRKDNVNHICEDKTKFNRNSMEKSNKIESPVELKHNSNDEDISFNAKITSGNHNNVESDIKMVIIEKTGESDNLNYIHATALNDLAEVEDDVIHDCAFTDDSCIQYIDA